MNWTDKVKPKRTIDPPGPYGYTNADPLSNPLGMDDLLAAEKEFKKFLDGSVGLPSPEILIMTEEHWKLLREEAASITSPRPENHLGYFQLDLLGIPVEVYPTYEECRARAFLLLDEGKRVGLVEDQPNEQS